MKLNFFTMSDLTIKYRRNLLFVCVLCVIHFGVTSLGTLRVFNVTIPDSFLNIGLPLIVIWFALNYFYNLYAEYTQWKIVHIPILEPPRGVEMENWDQNTTLITELGEIGKGRINVQIKFNAQTSVSTSKDKTPEVINKETRNLITRLEDQIMLTLKTDLVRIKNFQFAIKNYNIANQLRIYFLDILIPLLLVLVASVLAYLGT